MWPFYCQHVRFFESEKLAEGCLDYRLEPHLVVVVGALCDDGVQLVEDDLVPGGVGRGIYLREVEVLATLWNMLLDPLLEGVQLEDGGISYGSLEVGVVERVSTVGEADSGGISTVAVEGVTEL